jgi:hypothetical protein
MSSQARMQYQQEMIDKRRQLHEAFEANDCARSTTLIDVNLSKKKS